MKNRLISKYIKPPHDLSHFQHRSRKSIFFFFIALFLFLHVMLQKTMDYKVMGELLIAFWLLGRTNSYMLAFVMTLSVSLLFSGEEVWYYVGLIGFSFSAFSGAVVIIGGARNRLKPGCIPGGIVSDCSIDSSGGSD